MQYQLRKYIFRLKSLLFKMKWEKVIFFFAQFKITTKPVAV